MEKMDFREELGKICPKAKNGANIYFFGCGKYFEDLRAWYRAIAHINLEDYAYAFIDNDVNKQGKKFYYGKDVVSPDLVTPDNAVVLIVAHSPNYAIDKQMMDKSFFWQSDLFTVNRMERILISWIFKEFIKLKDKHSGDRCFIVGNGTSLSMSDLDMLVNEKTFAMNRIYKCFDSTVWRPTYYISEDALLLGESYDEILHKIKSYKFLRYDSLVELIRKNKNICIDNTFFFHLILNEYNRPDEYRKPTFGEYPDMFRTGFTSTYSCLQLAVFMGFKEIYMIGFDNDYSIMLENSGEVVITEKEDYFKNDYEDSGSLAKYKKRGLYIFPIDMANSAFQSAKEYVQNHGIILKNATRGGKLEVFERIDFDSLF